MTRRRVNHIWAFVIQKNFSGAFGAEHVWECCWQGAGSTPPPPRGSNPPPPPAGGSEGAGGGSDREVFEGKGPQRLPQQRLDRRLEEVAKGVGGGYCRLQMPLRPALGVRETVAGHRLGALRGGGGGTSPTSNASLGSEAKQKLSVPQIGLQFWGPFTNYCFVPSTTFLLRVASMAYDRFPHLPPS